MVKKGLVLTKKNKYGAYEALRVVEEANKVGREVDLVYYEDLSLAVGTDGAVFVNGQNKFDLSGYSWAYMRSANISQSVKLTHIKVVLIDELVSRGVKVLNSRSLSGFVVLPKLRQQYLLAKAGLPVIPVNYNLESLDGAQWPLMVKKMLGSMGKGVYKIENEDEYADLVAKIGKEKVLLQEYVPNDGDLRVMVLGDRVIGAMKRKPAAGSYLSNISAGGKAEKVELSAEISDLAVKASKACELEHCGVDIMYDLKGNPYILEVNRHPQFAGLESIGVNVASEIVGYLEEVADEKAGVGSGK